MENQFYKDGGCMKDIKKVLFVSRPYYSDSDIMFVKGMSELCDFNVVYEMNPLTATSMLLKLKTLPSQSGLYGISELDAEPYFSGFLNPDKVKVLYRATPKIFSAQTLKIRRMFNAYLKDLAQYLIHYNGFTYSDLVSFPLNGTAKINTVHDPVPHSSDSSLKSRFLYKFQHLLLRNKVILNASQREEFIKSQKLDPDRVLSSSFCPYEYLKCYLPENGEPDRKNIVLFFGRIERYKGVEFLLEAFNKVRKRHKEYELVIAGKGDIYWDKSLHEGNEQVRIINRFITTEELARLLSKSVCTVCPYKDSTQSGVVMTSYAFDVPVIATRVGGMPEFIEDGKTGFLVPKEDADALAGVLDDYLGNRALQIRLSANIKEDALKESRSMKGICMKIYNFYSHILEKYTV